MDPFSIHVWYIMVFGLVIFLIGLFCPEDLVITNEL